MATDVQADSGPHAYMEGTHDPENIHEIRSQWPGGLDEFDKWYLGTLRKTDGQVKRIFGRDPASLTGPAGSVFLVDTFGIHKGTPPKRGERLICQILYGVTSLYKTAVEPLPMGSANTRHIQEEALAPPLDYVNRMFLMPAEGA